MIKYKDKNYELKFTKKRIKVIEQVIGHSVIAELTKSDGVLTLNTVDVCLKFGIKEPQNTDYVEPALAEEIGDAYMEEVGYGEVIKEIILALKRDLPFFFRVA